MIPDNGRAVNLRYWVISAWTTCLRKIFWRLAALQKNSQLNCVFRSGNDRLNDDSAYFYF
ncbi:hypothetical protein CW304_33115 [Bacillus sp. UFRGS-B20]|nr:hypothetical protein CW304_33115 [Bacillus sp. UFRGS-B20]